MLDFCYSLCRRYIQLHQHRLELLRQGSHSLLPLGAGEVFELHALEAHLATETILLCRQLAEKAVEQQSEGPEGAGAAAR